MSSYRERKAHIEAESAEHPLGVKILAVAIMCVAAFVGLVIAIARHDPEKAARERAEREAARAEDKKKQDKHDWEMSLWPKVQDAVRSKLAAPDEAEFPDLPRIRYHDDGQVTVYGQVTSRNRLGVKLRADYFVSFDKQGNLLGTIVNEKGR